MTPAHTDLAALAADFVNSTHRNIFLTGKAGTGKTTFLRGLAQHTHKRLAIVAPTGIAALNAGGVTIHSLFMLPPATFVPDPTRKLTEEDHGLFNQAHLRRNSLSSQKKQVLRALDLLVIDEVSMLRADLLDAMDIRLRLTRGNHHQPFGGVQVLFIGDLLQLPPVVNKHADVLKHYYPTPHFFQARALRNDGLVYIELNKVYRQADASFVDVLNHLRENQLRDEDIVLLNRYVRTGPEGAITLTTHNRQADDINQRQLKKLPGEAHTFAAHITGDFPENLYPIDAEITLKEGARVMFIRNDSSMEKAYYNGKLATVQSIHEGEISVIKDGETEPFTLHQEEWENKRYVVGKDSKELEEEITGTFRHYPLRLAWAVTVHKSQGLTFDEAILDLGRSFSPGQVYVALSRLRSLDGLYLTTPLSRHLVAADGMALSYARQQPAPEILPTILEEGQRRYLQFMF